MLTPGIVIFLLLPGFSLLNINSWALGRMLKSGSRLKNMATPVKGSLNRPTRELGTSINFENSNPNLSRLTPRRNPTAVFKSSDKKSGKSTKLSKTLASPSISRGKASLAKKKLPLKDSESSVASLAHPAHLLLTKKNQKIRIRAPLSSPIEPPPSENRKDQNLKINLHDISNKRDTKSEVNISDGVPHLGDGRVMFLAKAFEKLFTKNEEEEALTGDKRDFTRVLPEFEGLQKAEETEISYSVGSASSERMDKTGEQSSVESNFKRDSQINDGGNRIKRNSTGSSGRSWTKKSKITNPHPFMLKTEERGRIKEEHFLEKMKEMLLEEERLRVPVAQGLPWSTDEPEYPFKPPIKEPTEPVDLILQTDLRAVDRAEFDLQVAEKINFLEKIKSERERQRKIEEEEEIKRLRKELVPKALPMPCFDRPFFPRRSTLSHTIPKEPKFHSKQQNDKP